MQYAFILCILKNKTQTFAWLYFSLKLTLHVSASIYSKRSVEKCFPSFLLPHFLKPTPVELSSQWLPLNPKVDFQNSSSLILSAAFYKVDHSHIAETFSSVSLVIFSSLATPFISLLIPPLLPNIWFLFSTYIHSFSTHIQYAINTLDDFHFILPCQILSLTLC